MVLKKMAYNRRLVVYTVHDENDKYSAITFSCGARTVDSALEVYEFLTGLRGIVTQYNSNYITVSFI